MSAAERRFSIIENSRTNPLTTQEVYIEVQTGVHKLVWGIRDNYRVEGVIRPQLPDETESCATFEPLINWNDVRSSLQTHKLNGSESDSEDTGSPPVDDFNVLDVEAMCVINAPANCKYVALSYVWGKASLDDLRTLGANAALMETPGSLSTVHLPNTFVDAIEACSKLGYRYLWINRLCTIGATEAEQAHISGMDSIFASAALCIVAAAGADADHGLLGVSLKRLGREIESKVHGMTLQAYLISDPLEIVNRSTWNRRAWTYQELMLSKRLMFFTHCGVIVHERLERLGQRDVTYGVDFFFDSSEMWIGMLFRQDKFDYMVRDYSERQLSYGSDILRAFSGILSHKFGKETTHGLPNWIFDYAIMWSTDDYLSPRRTSATQPGPLFPSWSWTSAYGRIRSPDGFGIVISGVALWATAIAGEGCQESLRFMIPHTGEWTPVYQSVSSLISMLAWRLRCIPGEPPVDGRIDNFNSEEVERLRNLWPDYKSFWEDAFGGFVINSPFSNDDIKAALTPSRLLVYTQEAVFKVEMMTNWETAIAKTMTGRQFAAVKKTPGKRYFAIKSQEDTLAGLICLGADQAHQNFPDGHGASRFLALSVHQYPMEGLRIKWSCNKCGLFHVPEFELEGLRTSCPSSYRRQSSHDPDNNAGSRKHMSYVLNGTQTQYSPGIYFIDSRGERMPNAFHDPGPMMMNVMLIHTDATFDDERIVQRVGIGQIYLKKWAKADRSFRTRILT